MCGGHQQNIVQQKLQDKEEANRRVSFVEFYTIVIASAISWTSMRMSADWMPAPCQKIHMQKRNNKAPDPKNLLKKNERQQRWDGGWVQQLKHRTYG